jgi:glycosyltransferase involved in cell wall biosynthesis
VKILFFITEDWFFCSHFIERAIAARKAGNEVVVLTRVGKSAGLIRDEGIGVIPLEIKRRNFSPLREIHVIYSVWRAYKSQKPDLVHHVALKPILYGTLAARLCGIRAVVNAPVGMGFVFTSTTLLARLLRPVVQLGLRAMLNPPGSKVVFENSDDINWAVSSNLVRPESAVLIRGAGVNLEKFCPSTKAVDVPLVVLSARMLWDKGIREFVEAASIIEKRGIRARLVLVGGVDTENPSSIPEAQLEQWAKDGVVEWWGHQKDMADVLGQADIACLPSYREGLPKSLIEAAACGLPIVTTNVPGCREVVEHGVQGLLVPVRDARALADALASLIADPPLRARMGAAARARAEAEFGRDAVIDRTLALYREIAP